MELLKMKSESVNPRKRPLAVRDFPPGCGINEAERKPMKVLTKAHSDLGKVTLDRDDKLVDSNRAENNKFNSSKPKEFGGNKPYAASRPASKVKYWEPDLTEGGFDQKPKVTTTYGLQRKNINNDDSKVRKMIPDIKDKLVVSPRPVENSKLKSFEPKELGRSKSYVDSRSKGKVKFWDSNCEVQKPIDTTTIVSPKEQIQHEKIKKAMAVFDQVHEQFSQENRSKPKGEKIPSWRVPTEVARIVRQKLRWIDPGKMVGSVCGVQIGDKFKYRSQLIMFGLHSQPQSGIDFANIGGKNLAISVVDAQRYSNNSGSSDTLVYSGQGGVAFFGSKLPPKDQKLEKGNLALKNSMNKKTQVRVIRKVQGYGKDWFVYDGLYIVDDLTEDKSAVGKIVFKFHLKRVPGQPSLYKMLKW